MPTLGGNSVAVAAIQRAKSLMDLMQQRSPGKRTTAHLAQTKHRKAALHQRALPKMRKSAPVLAMAPMPAFPTELPPAFVDLVAPPIPMQLASLEAVSIGPLAEQAVWPFPSSTTPGGFILPPAAGGTTTPPPPPVVNPPPPAAVPEPQTWSMMLLGFAMIGSALRSRRNREQAAA